MKYDDVIAFYETIVRSEKMNINGGEGSLPIAAVTSFPPFPGDITIGTNTTPLAKEKNMIGGDTCHLCGAHRTIVTTVQQYSKKWNSTSKNFMSVTTYECGTTITKNRKKAADSEPEVRVGSKCIEVGK